MKRSNSTLLNSGSQFNSQTNKKPKKEEKVKIYLLGEEVLRTLSTKVSELELYEDSEKRQAFLHETETLLLALKQFREENGFGRAISAPQIGVNKRMIALNLGKEPFMMINPQISWKSEEMFSLWDDCMSFPWLMVKVKRFKSISVNYLDENGKEHQMEKVDISISELLQHEIDHLDGILALDRVLDKKSIISRIVYEEKKQEFDKEVDYFIVPTI